MTSETSRVEDGSFAAATFEAAASDAAASDAAASDAITLQRLRTILVDQYGIERGRLHADARLEELDLDSLGMMELLFKIEDEFGISIPNEAAQVFNGPDVTLKEVADRVDGWLTARLDAGVGAEVDAATDAAADAGVDAGADAATNAGVDAGIDAGIGSGSKPTDEAGISAGTRTEPDVTAGAATETGTVTGVAGRSPGR